MPETSAESQEPLARFQGPVRGLVLVDEAVLAAIGEFVRRRLQGGDAAMSAAATDALSGRGPVFIELRAAGELLGEAWAEGETQVEALENALGRARTAVDDLARVDAVLLCLSFDHERVDMADPAARRRMLANTHRGVRGIEFVHAERVERVSPTTIVATNREPPKILDAFRNERRLSMKDMEGDAVKVATFAAAQILVELAPAPRTTPLVRGKRWVPIEAVTHENVRMLERELGDFMVRNVQPDGRMLYMYYPTREVEDLKRQNMIRQWMATICLCRLGRFRQDARVYDVAERNIRYNLRNFYQASGKLGLIEEWDKKVKLGSVALAILGLVEHPKRQQFKRQEQRMRATVDYLWQESGEFRTFFKPATRNDVQNFYPGEAQLCWALLWRESKDPALLDRFMRSFRYYREWHFVPENRNPAFIPWHTQAYYNVWLETRDPELQQFVFDMNDWLLGVQQWDDVVYDDCRGRFHDPNRPFGPPHASSTGVYMEGLIDAFCLARTVGDRDRQEAYRRSIVRGLRSINQLMYGDEVNMYYIRQRGLVRGGVPTNEYDNVVRIDNIQHNLMAIFKILAEFAPGDYRP